MFTYKCQKCSHTVEIITPNAVVMHRCPSNNRKPTIMPVVKPVKV
jgi:DNA-directed RNA polymerase subunit RPC12/RpoP